MVSRIGIAAMLSVLATFAQAEEVVKFAYFAPEDEAAYARVLKPWMDEVNAAGKGAIRIVGYPNGVLGRALPQQPQMVLDGVADIGWLVVSTTPGRFPDTTALELPGLYDNVGQATRVNNRVMSTLPMAGFENYKIIAAFGSAPLGIYTASERCELSALKGTKLRVTTPNDGAALVQIGAVPIQIPINEVTESLGRRTIDGAVTNPQTLFDFGINRVTRCVNAAGLSSALLVLVMNKARYEALPPAARDALDKYSGDWLADLYAVEMTKVVDDLNDRLRREPQQKMVQPGAADRKVLDQAFAAVRTKVLASSTAAAKIIKAIDSAKAELGAGR